jgi:hypothetical protein
MTAGVKPITIEERRARIDKGDAPHAREQHRRAHAHGRNVDAILHEHPLGLSERMLALILL